MDPRDVARRGGVARWLGAAVVLLAAVPPLLSGELQARSSDGRWLLHTEAGARELVVVDAATGTVARRIAAADRRGEPARVARLIDAAPRASFIALLTDVAEAWELPYGRNAEPVYEGTVHDYRMAEGIASRGPLPIRRVVLDAPIVDALFAPGFEHFVGVVPGGKLHVVNLNVRRRIESVDSGGDPRPEKGSAWQQGARTVFLIPDAALPRLLVLDGRTWKLAAEVPLPAIAATIVVGADAIYVTTASGPVTLRPAELRLD